MTHLLKMGVKKAPVSNRCLYCPFFIILELFYLIVPYTSLKDIFQVLALDVLSLFHLFFHGHDKLC